MEITRKELEIAASVVAFSVSLAASVVLGAWIVSRLPPDYLQNGHAPDPIAEARPAWQRMLLKIGKNTAGVLLIALGVILSLPGVPGQGVLTILVGVMLLDVPFMRRLERRILANPTVLRGVNRLREGRGHPPLEPPREPPAEPPREPPPPDHL